MKNIAFSILLLFSFMILNAQTPSDCAVPQELIENYERDIKNLSLKRMAELSSPDFALISIPQAWQDTIAGGMAAIMNALSLPESDSVFNLYCVHDLTGPLQIYNEMLIQVDVSYPWTQAWQNLNALTGNPAIDALVTRYGLTVSAFYDWSFADYALLHTDSLLNIYALIDSLVAVEGIISGEPNAFFGTAGKIEYQKLGDIRYYDFYFQFNDCFDGCDNHRKWMFKVNADCSVEYLGAENWGVFGIEPLPAPVNCNIFTSLRERQLHKRVSIYPNPSDGVFSIERLETGNILIIYDASGRILQMKRVEGTTTQISIQTKGIYVLEVKRVNGIERHKLVVR
jgi:hypothetical protein